LFHHSIKQTQTLVDALSVRAEARRFECNEQTGSLSQMADASTVFMQLSANGEPT
jgi:hypothetical protein